MTAMPEAPTSLDLLEFEADLDEDDETVHITTCSSVNRALCGIDLTYAEWADSMTEHPMCKVCLDRVNKPCGRRCRRRH
jgi:hypothetical protein